MRSFQISTLVAVYALFAGCYVSEELDEDDLGEDSSELTTYSVFPSSGYSVVSLAVYPGIDNVLIMSSPSVGNWKFETRGSLVMILDSSPCLNGNPPTPDTVVYTYWRDESNPNNPWNYWPGGGALCYPTSGWSTNLYSGSSNISYKFVYAQYASYGQTVYAKFTKQ